MRYKSTRSNIMVSPSEAILNGLAFDKGLYVPETLIKIQAQDYIGRSYQEIATKILSLYFDDFDAQTIDDAVMAAYNKVNFSHPEITGIHKLGPSTALLELFYGQTCAFKDQALSIYPYLMKAAMKKHDKSHLIILTATSGDTGKAAMEALKDVPGLAIIVLYPNLKTSTIQALQMKTQTGHNVYPIAVDGDFDFCQKTVKTFFQHHPNLPISSANSINIARLLPQVVYYFDAFNRLSDITKPIDVYVPTGNFGNALAAYIAYEMGCPIQRIVVCTNENDVLHDFITTGIYDIRHRKLLQTPSPSMDILVASNLERLLAFMFKDDKRVQVLMRDLEQDGMFSLTQKEHKHLTAIFTSQHTSNAQTEAIIKDVFESTQYLIDPHTATAIPHDETGHYALIVSTASPYKFPDIYRACFNLKDLTDFEVLSTIEALSHQYYPPQLKSLPNQAIKHDLHAKQSHIQDKIMTVIQELQNEV